MKNVLLIGCGHMGSALLASWLKSKDYQLTVIDSIKYKSLLNKFTNKKVKILKSISNLKNSSKYDFVVLAVRPVDLDKALVETSKIKFKNKTTIISVVAGKKIKIIKNKFKNLNNFFRIMPNIPALIGQSMNCVVSNKEANNLNKKEVIKLFSYSGKTILLKNEKQIDMSTAISGSGPGFIFNMIDAMEKSAIKLGFNKNISKILVSQTFKGSINLFLKNNSTAQDLVNTVATKGGTTEAGLKIMKKKKLHEIFVEVSRASYKKAKQQGK